MAERLGTDPQLLRDLADRPMALALLGGDLVDEPDRALLQLRCVPLLDLALAGGTLI